MSDRKEEETTGRRTLKNRKRPDKFKLSQEAAEDNLMLFLDYYEIYPDEFETEEEKAAVNLSFNKLINAIRLERIEFKEDGISIQTLINGSKIEYTALRGTAKVQGKYKKNESEIVARTRRLYSIMGSLSGLGSESMAKMNAIDLMTMECVGFLLSTV